MGVSHSTPFDAELVNFKTPNWERVNNSTASYLTMNEPIETTLDD
jgi:hypothetical protein